MSIPVSSGIGTGAAQIYDTSRSYNAMGKVLDANADLMEYQNKMAALKKRDEQEAKERDYTKIAALQKAAEVDYGNMKPVYVDLTKAEAQAFKDKYAGKYEQILNNNPEIVNEYYKDLANLKANVSKRVESWEQQKEIIARITKNPEKYKNSQIALGEELYLNPDTDMSKYQSSFGEKLQIGNPFDDAAQTYEALFYKPKTSVETDKGIYANTGNVYEDEQVSLAEFKKQLAANPELKVRMYAALEDDADIEKDSRGVPTIAGQEQLLQKSYKLTKALLPESKEIVNTTKEQKDDSSGRTPFDNYRFEPFTSGKNKGFVVANTKGSINPIEISIVNKDGSKSTISGVPAEIYKDAKGKMRTRFTKMKKAINDRNEESFVAGETVDVEIGDKGSFAAKVKGTYGQNPFDVWDNMYKDKYVIDGVTYTKDELTSNGWTENDLKQIK